MLEMRLCWFLLNILFMFHHSKEKYNVNIIENVEYQFINVKKLNSLSSCEKENIFKKIILKFLIINILGFR